MPSVGNYDNERVVDPSGRRLMSLGQSLAHGKRKFKKDQMRMQAELQDKLARQAEKRARGGMSMFQAKQLGLQESGQKQQERMLEKQLTATKEQQLGRFGHQTKLKGMDITQAEQERALRERLERERIGTTKELSTAQLAQRKAEFKGQLPGLQAQAKKTLAETEGIRGNTEHAAKMSPLYQENLKAQTAQTGAQTKGIGLSNTRTGMENKEYQMMQPYRLEGAKINTTRQRLGLESAVERRNLERLGNTETMEEAKVRVATRVKDLAKKYNMSESEVRHRIKNGTAPNSWLRGLGRFLKSRTIFGMLSPDTEDATQDPSRYTSPAAQFDPGTDFMRPEGIMSSYDTYQQLKKAGYFKD